LPKTPPKKTNSTKSKTKTTQKKRGRPTKYKPQYCGKLVDWFKKTINSGKFPTLTEFAYFEINVRKKTLLGWKEKYPAFLLAYKKAKFLQAKFLQWQCWFDKSISGEYKSPFTIFAGKNIFGWHDQIQLQGDENNPITIVAKWEK
jgi:hypothetical protein